MSEPRKCCKTCRFFNAWYSPPHIGEGNCYAWPKTIQASHGDAEQRYLHVWDTDCCEYHQPETDEDRP